MHNAEDAGVMSQRPMRKPVVPADQFLRALLNVGPLPMVVVASLGEAFGFTWPMLTAALKTLVASGAHIVCHRCYRVGQWHLTRPRRKRTHMSNTTSNKTNGGLPKKRWQTTRRSR